MTVDSECTRRRLNFQTYPDFVEICMYTRKDLSTVSLKHVGSKKTYAIVHFRKKEKFKAGKVMWHS